MILILLLKYNIIIGCNFFIIIIIMLKVIISVDVTLYKIREGEKNDSRYFRKNVLFIFITYR